MGAIDMTKTSILVWAALTELCLAQTFVYSTYANGSVSAYIIVSNGSSIAPVTSDESTISSTPTTSYPTSTTSSSSIMLPTTPYTGQAMLTGTCTIPMYTAIRFEKGNIIQVPLIGCSDDRPDCCPSLSPPEESTESTSESSNGTTATSSASLTPTGVISLLSASPLTICPSDMVDDDPVCCPSGFTKWNTPILGNVPCYSPLSSSYPVPSTYLNSITSATAAAATVTSGDTATQSVVIIVETVFALGLPCADEEEGEGGEDGDEDKHSGLSTGAKAGIGVGAALGALLIVGLTLFILKRRKDKNSTGPGSESVIAQTSDYPIKMPPGPAPSSGGWSPASAHDVGYAGYGQGFVDGVKAALVPPQQGQMPPQSPPPPFYAQPQVPLQQQQRNSYIQPPPMQQYQPQMIVPQQIVEAPGHYGPYNRWSAQEQAAELSGTNSTAGPRSEVMYNPSSSGRG